MSNLIISIRTKNVRPSAPYPGHLFLESMCIFIIIEAIMHVIKTLGIANQTCTTAHSRPTVAKRGLQLKPEGAVEARRLGYLYMA